MSGGDCRLFNRRTSREKRLVAGDKVIIVIIIIIIIMVK